MNVIALFTECVDALIADKPTTAMKLKKLGYTDKEFVERKLKALELKEDDI